MLVQVHSHNLQNHTAEAGSVNRKIPHIHAAINNTHPAGPIANAYMLVCGRANGLE